MALALGDLNLGKVDGKHEYLSPQSERDKLFYDAFLVPETINPERLSNSEIFFIEGYRGTGKTSLLRWYAENRSRAGCTTNFILFKSDIPEAQRVGLSKEIGVSWTDVDPGKMEVSQDFKSTWTWFIHHKIGELLLADPNLAESSSTAKYLKVLGINNPSTYTKILGFLPRLEGATVKIKSDLNFFELELEGDFRGSETNGQTTLEALNRKLGVLSQGIKLLKPIFIFFDELEVFFDSSEQHRRDQRMVRDLIFSIALANDLFRSHKIPIHVIGAVRSEVVDSMGALGQEVDRLVHDRGQTIAWHFAKRSLDHPLIQIIRRKILASEKSAGIEESTDPIGRYFPARTSGQFLDAFLLDRSFYKPRDIVWRLTIAQKQFPKSTKFDEEILHQTEIEYSSKLWDEIRYELSATYSSSEIDVIEMVFAGGPVHFDLQSMDERFLAAERHSINAKQLNSRRSTRDILSDLYRLGAIGNSFRAGPAGTDIRNRWAFRGDPTLLADKHMTIHPALVKRLSAVPKRKRGN